MYSFYPQRDMDNKLAEIERRRLVSFNDRTICQWTGTKTVIRCQCLIHFGQFNDFSWEV